MLLDSLAQFATAEEITFGAGTNLIGDVIDLSVVRDIGDGTPIWMVFQVATAFASGTSFQFIIASDSQAAIATNGAESRHYLSDVFLTAELTQGFQIGVALPLGDVSGGITPYERFLGVLGVGVGTHDAGNVNIFLTLTPPSTHRIIEFADANN